MIEILNEDGTKYEPPVNPLLEKWEKLYPPTRHGEPCGPMLGYFEDGRPIMNYSCVLCHEEKCYHSNDWVVPEEDREIYDAWKKECNDYIKKHGLVFKLPAKSEESED